MTQLLSASHTVAWQCQAPEEQPRWTSICTTTGQREAPCPAELTGNPEGTRRYQEAKPEKGTMCSLWERQNYRRVVYPIILWPAGLKTCTPGPWQQWEQTRVVSCTKPLGMRNIRVLQTRIGVLQKWFSHLGEIFNILDFSDPPQRKIQN